MEKILSSLNSLAETWLTFGSASYHIDLNDTLLGGLGLLLLYVCYLIVKLVLQPLWRKKYTQKPPRKPSDPPGFQQWDIQIPSTMAVARQLLRTAKASTDNDSPTLTHPVPRPLPDSDQQLPELYASAENFNNESKKSNFQKLCATSFEEAQQLLGKNLGTVPFAASGAERKDEPHPAVQSPVSNQEQNLTSLADLLHHSLLMGSLVPLEQLSRTQRRLTQAGIPPPVHMFPYGFRTDEPMVTPTPTFRQRLPSHTFRKLLLASVTPERLVFEDKSIQFFSLEPGKQFLDLVDLEWRYFNGLAKWGHIPRKFSFMDIKYNTEKRFVESQGMPGPVFPPLVRKTLVIYPQLDHHEEGHYSLKWNV
ncbi:uncharacterized protein LOC121443893 [Microtus oregoni]|uniref:uncharacterized protein LOC121443893 n=1 Tax=Microtus oregoni TaxID=111838 RepID=UPI001BB13A4C|nr:uncharacterized protein LOC121443893 [Microtus oregoni]